MSQRILLKSFLHNIRGRRNRQVSSKPSPELLERFCWTVRSQQMNISVPCFSPIKLKL